MAPKKTILSGITRTKRKSEKSQTEEIIESFKNHLVYSQAKDKYSATDQDIYNSTALVCRDRLIERWINTQQLYYKNDVKRIYYMSLEFLIGRTLGNSLINLDMYGETARIGISF